MDNLSYVAVSALVPTDCLRVRLIREVGDAPVQDLKLGIHPTARKCL